MTAMADPFKKHNPMWVRVAMVITDQDMNERTVFGRAFPNVIIHPCLFHLLRTFRRQITCKRFDSTSWERDLVLEIMSRLAYAKSIKKYIVVYTELLGCGLEPVIHHFNNNWHSSREE